MSRLKFRLRSFLKLLVSMLALGIFSLVIHEKFGISFQTMKVITVVLIAFIFVIDLIKIRARRPPPTITNRNEIIELQKQLDTMLKNESSKNS